jgi:hypothetical protein
MDDYPDNTTAALRSSVPEADVVKCDVQRYGPDEFVVHDHASRSRSFHDSVGINEVK